MRNCDGTTPVAFGFSWAPSLRECPWRYIRPVLPVVQHWQEWSLVHGSAPESALDHEIFVLCESEKNNIEQDRHDQQTRKARREVDE